MVNIMRRCKIIGNTLMVELNLTVWAISFSPRRTIIKIRWLLKKKFTLYKYLGSLYVHQCQIPPGLEEDEG